MSNLHSKVATLNVQSVSEWCEQKGPLLFAIWFVLTIVAPHQDNYKHYFHLVIIPVVLILLGARATRINWNNPLLIAALVYFSYAGIATIVVGTGPLGDHFRALRWCIEVTTVCLALSIWLPQVIEKNHWWARFFLLLALCGSLLSLFKFSYFYQYSGRLSGFGALHNPIQAASVLLVYFALGHFMLSCMQHHPPVRTDKVLVFMAFWSVAAAVVLSGSRAPIAALVFYSIFLAGLNLFHRASRRLDIILTIFTLFLAGFMIFYWYGGGTFYQELMARGFSFRLDIWHGYLIALKEFVWFGVGLGTQPEQLTEAVKYWQSQGIYTAYHPHSVYVGILAKTGLVGAAFFLLMSGILIFKIFKCKIAFDERIRLTGLLILVFLLTLTASQGLISSIKAIWLYLWLPVFFVWYWCAYADIRNSAVN